MLHIARRQGRAHQNDEITRHTCADDPTRTPTTPNAGEDVGQQEPSDLAGGKAKRRRRVGRHFDGS